MMLNQTVEVAPRREPSIMDVAREAGVSAQTVSRVATGKNVVRPQTREKVVEAMHRLGYRPNGAARALKSGRYRNIGVIMFSLSSYGNMRTLEAIAGEAARVGYALTLIPLGAASQSRVSGAFARLSEQAVDGIVILIEAHQLNESDIELPQGLPVVVVDSNAQYDQPVVDTDQAQGARLATEHLLDMGHRTVWHVAGPDESFSAQRRRESWKATLHSRGAAAPEALVGDWSANSGRAAGRELALREEVTAVFAANDQMALGVMHAIHEAGLRIPEDISVVGFDDTPESASFWPALTTIRQHFDQVGVAALQALVAAIEDQPRERGDLVPTELIVRRSTAAPSR
ncbi:MAG: LacI family DNA-binding transcriptional regulator [Microbacterium sp.]|uniref:LacI family DNA-binding transcriptional regulator n=1 Tax=Microbacterium sp. TaxID=51671 RepID=UPI00262B33F9|nr:LacI family DNA-binding transcriptional regulator [Microbacterium sp.]MCX6503270.1 LacI family DNA-binding transcriptional regulator [Microbacterium sp.]